MSTQSRPSVKALTYVSEGHALDFDLFHPGGGEVCPVVILVHGGGWVSGDKDNMAILAEVLSLNGFAAACVQYRFAPQFPFPAAVNDLLAFTEHLRANAAALGIKPDKIGAWGISAGGHLVAMLGCKASIQAVVDMCGITDLVDWQTKFASNSHFFIRDFLKAGTAEECEAASPLFQATAQAAPHLIIHGQKDDLVPHQQSVEYAARLKELGVPTEFVSLKYEGHSFSFEAWPEIEHACLQYLASHLL